VVVIGHVCGYASVVITEARTIPGGVLSGRGDCMCLRIGGDEMNTYKNGRSLRFVSGWWILPMIAIEFCCISAIAYEWLKHLIK
jgi:hypothetical protein